MRPRPRDVIWRDAHQRRIGGIGGTEFDSAGDITGQVVVSQLNGFGPRRGTRGEQHDRHVVGVGEDRDGLGGSRGLDELVGRHHRLAETGHDIAVLGVDHDQRRGQPIDEFAQPLWTQPIIQWRERRVRARRREQQQRE